LFIASCSGTRNLPEGELLYGGAKIKWKARNKNIKALKAEFEAIVRPNLIRPFSVLDPNYLFIKLLVLKKKRISLLVPKWEKHLFTIVK
jgi:hypothetical protein